MLGLIKTSKMLALMRFHGHGPGVFICCAVAAQQPADPAEQKGAIDRQWLAVGGHRPAR